MAEALGIASSIAGLVSLADTVVRLGYKYIRDVKDAEESVQSLVKEVNNLSGVLHSLENVAQALEAQDTSVHSSSKIINLHSCQITLEKITAQLEKAIPEVKSTSQKLKWPFKKAAISELMKEIQNHKSTMMMALNTQQMWHTSAPWSTLVDILANQEQINKGVAAINAKMEASRIELQRLAAGTIDVMKWQNSNIRLRQPGTGVWFTESKEFKNWASTDNSKLWIYGIPGAGKTVLMASVIQEIEKTQDPSHGMKRPRLDSLPSDIVLIFWKGVAKFYCDYKDTQTHDPRTILGALARQLILQHKDAFTQLESFCEKHHMTEITQGSATTDNFCEFIVDLSRNFSTTSIIVDGLDEIAEDRAEVTRLLKSLNNPSGTIKTLLASRNEIDIKNVLANYPFVSIAAKSGDLRLYVHSEIEKRTKMGKLRIRDHNLKDHIAKVLTEGADGITDRDRREALSKLPPDLPKSYERILDRVNRSSKENQTLVRHTLLWVVYAKKPLKISQLLQALAVRPGDETFEKENMTTLDELLNWCSSLIRQKSQSDELELAHFTVKEYLLSLSEECGPDLSQYRLSGDHAEIVRVCCNFLSLLEFDGTPLPVTDFDSEVTDFDETWREFEDKYSFMKYVLSFWTDHIHQSNWSEISNDVLLLFDETRSSYRLWAFGYYHYTMLSRCKSSHLLKLDDLLPTDHLNCVIGSSRPSALHWAAIIALPDVCIALINRGANVSASSVVGSPTECALLFQDAIYEDVSASIETSSNYDTDRWRWESRKRVMKHLIAADTALDNVDIIKLLYRKLGPLTYCFDELGADLLRDIFDKNPTFSIETLLAFFQYTSDVSVWNIALSDLEIQFSYHGAGMLVELLAWGARTNFAHFTPGTLPLFIAIIHDDLAISDYSPSSIQFFFDIDFLGISRNDGIVTNPISQDHAEHWMTKMSTFMLEFIQNSRVNSSNYFEKIVLRLFSAAGFVFGFIFRLGNNNIVLDFNWRNEVGNTVLQEFMEECDMGDDWQRVHRIFLKAVLQFQANLTISNNLNITPIETLLSNTEPDSDEMLSFVKIWRAGGISNACGKNPDLLERLLDAAEPSDMLELILRLLAKDIDRHTQSTQNLMARYCTVDYMKELFILRLKDGAQKDHILALEGESSDEEGSDEEGSDDQLSVDGENEAYTSTDEEENGDNAPSIDELTRRGKSSITKDIHSSFSFVEKDQDNGLPVIESSECACSMTEGENIPTNKNLAESDESLAVDEKTHSSLHLLSGSHDSADFGKLRLLLVHNPDLEIRNHQDLTPLAITIRSKNLRAMYALLISGASIEVHVGHGQTCLHLACYLGNEEAVWALLHAGANISHKDHHGNTAEELAELIGRSDIVDLFSRRGEDGSRAGSQQSEYSTDESPDEDLSDNEESDVSDSGQLPPLLTAQDLALRPK
ncbi:hypothetical protein BOTCAL_0232g00060 [Botryotinia calthae]|uniref:Uncharacterized protein n=1 Tax=Botryotinia calthae TaxID=38488 RepID=A0A4Y8CXI1_9HELO|nr:hypothetical protein BOTCAL_0232g00060 [Botryotinia calthae]